MSYKDTERQREAGRAYYHRNKSACNKRTKLWKESNRDRVRVSKRKSSEKSRSSKPEYTMFHRAKARAKERNIEFNIEVDDIVIPKCCPMLGLELKGCVGKRSDNSPSLDRIDNSKGYVKGNIQVISTKANQIKNNATADEIMKVALFCKTQEK